MPLLTELGNDPLGQVYKQVAPTALFKGSATLLFGKTLDDVLTVRPKFTGRICKLGNNFVRAALGSKGAVETRPAVSA
jgi:hypothetical protein